MIIQKLKNLENESIQRGIPILGRVKGAWLLQKIQEIKPREILELGTANGYSGIVLGSTGGTLTTIEINEKMAEEAARNFTLFNVKATIVLGDATAIIRELTKSKKESFEVIFIDFAKKKYMEVLEDCITLVKKKGFIIADNIKMEGCKDFKQAVVEDKRLKTEIIRLSDGLSCSQKVINEK